MSEQSKIEEYKRRLEEHEAKEAKKAALFSPSDVLADSTTVRRVYVPEIDRVVEYCPLSLKDLEDVDKAKTTQERSRLVLWKMLHKANKEWTLEKVEQIPMDVAAAIIKHLTPPLTQSLKLSASGLEQTQQPSYTA